MDEIRRLIRLHERGIITCGELLDRLMAAVEQFPAEQRPAALDFLAAHAGADARDAAAILRAFQENDRLSKDLGYLRQHSPLQPGRRLALFGSYDNYSADDPPLWLQGHECYLATFLGFATCGEDQIPAALVKFDQPIDLPGHPGQSGILRTSYSSHAAAWMEKEGVAVAVYIIDAPEGMLAARCATNSFGEAAETHASYRLVEESDLGGVSEASQ